MSQNYPNHAFRGQRGTGCTFTWQDRVCAMGADASAHGGFAPVYEESVVLGAATPFPATVGVVSAPKDEVLENAAMVAWNGHADAVLALLRKKAGYGNAWQEQGYMGNLARILSKASRLKNITWKDGFGQEVLDPGPTHESVLDTLYDLSALCAFAINNIEDGNRWGR